MMRRPMLENLVKGRRSWEVHHEWQQEESPEESQLHCAVGELVEQPWEGAGTFGEVR